MRRNYKLPHRLSVILRSVPPRERPFSSSFFSSSVPERSSHSILRPRALCIQPCTPRAEKRREQNGHFRPSFRRLAGGLVLEDPFPEQVSCMNHTRFSQLERRSWSQSNSRLYEWNSLQRYVGSCPASIITDLIIQLSLGVANELLSCKSYTRATALIIISTTVDTHTHTRHEARTYEWKHSTTSIKSRHRRRGTIEQLARWSTTLCATFRMHFFAVKSWII